MLVDRFPISAWFDAQSEVTGFFLLYTLVVRFMIPGELNDCSKGVPVKRLGFKPSGSPASEFALAPTALKAEGVDLFLVSTTIGFLDLSEKSSGTSS